MSDNLYCLSCGKVLHSGESHGCPAHDDRTLSYQAATTLRFDEIVAGGTTKRYGRYRKPWRYPSVRKGKRLDSMDRWFKCEKKGDEPPPLGPSALSDDCLHRSIDRTRAPRSGAPAPRKKHVVRDDSRLMGI